MKKGIVILVFVIVIFVWVVVGTDVVKKSDQDSVSFDNAPLDDSLVIVPDETDSKIIDTFEGVCSSDFECVLKPKPYCCGNKTEYYNACYYVDEVPVSVDCVGGMGCPSIAEAESCECESGECVGISQYS
ncbi:hypothetical protein HOE04_01175 [archaeon]|jgi:hypothetical protein|nr:hypothetical protein [archaeon]